MNVWSKLFITALAFVAVTHAPEAHAKWAGSTGGMVATAVYAMCVLCLLHEVWNLPEKVAQ